jgi:hypothetical protein
MQLTFILEFVKEVNRLIYELTIFVKLIQLLPKIPNAFSNFTMLFLISFGILLLKNELLKSFFCLPYR